MSALIKSGDAVACHPLAYDNSVEKLPSDPEADRDHEIIRLRERISTLQFENERCAAAARREGVDEGRRRATDEFEHRRREALDQLEITCNKALERFSQTVLSVERLATMIAQAVLEQMLLGETHYREIARDAIAVRIKELDRSSILRMLVCSHDFPDQSELDQLADLCGIDQTVIEQGADMEPGQCRLELTLGVLDVGLRQQWDKLNRELLGSLHIGDQP